MGQTQYNSFDEMPMFLSVPAVAQLLGISVSAGYELMHSKGFPSTKVGCRIVVSRDKLKEWLEAQTAQ
jgi:excisionase family DNA binding protein